MPYRCRTCGATQEDKHVCEKPDCGFRIGRFVHLQDMASGRGARGGCIILAILGLAAAIVLAIPSLNHGAVDFFSRLLDGLVRWWFRH